MNLVSPKGAFKLWGKRRWLVPGLAGLLLVACLACQADSPPEQQAPAVEVTQGTQPSQPVAGAQPAIQSGQAGVQTSQAVVQPATAASTGSVAPTDSQPQVVIASPHSPEVPSVARTMEQQPAAEAVPAAASQSPSNAEPALAAAVVAQPEPAAEPAQPAAPRPQPGANPANPAEAPAVQPPVQPQPATAQPAPTATSVPPPADTPTPVIAEPLPDVGNRVGNRIPDITLELFGGATVSTSNLVEQGKPTFLFFTATT